MLETVRAVRRLAAVDERAMALGLRAGLKATDAHALVPDLVTAEAEPEADAAALIALCDWCVRFSPAVAADPPDGFFLDIAGTDHLWGGEAAMLADLRTCLNANGLTFRLAIADTPGPAWAVARFGHDGAIVSPGTQAEYLKPLPLQALRLDSAAAAQIERLGLRRMGQLMALPRDQLARRFGARTLVRLDQALGKAPEALAFRRPPTPWVTRLPFTEPISAPDDKARVCQDVCAKLCVRLEAEGRGARRFEITFHRLDGKVLSLAVGLALAGREARRIARLFQPRLEAIDPGFGIESVTLAAYEVEIISGRQGRIDSNPDAVLEDGLAPLIDRLANRLGPERIWRAAPVQSHIPERSIRRGRPLGAPPSSDPPWNPEAPRPVRLFRRPEPLEGVIALPPHDPLGQFRWRGRLHRVRLAEGPERLAEEWWRQAIEDVSTTHVRDYYRVEDEDGARFWLFRTGLYDPAELARWWLHGLFG